MSLTTSRLTSVLLALTGIVAVSGLPIRAAQAQNQSGTLPQVQNAEREQLEPVTIVKSRGTGKTDQLAFKAGVQISTVTAGKIIAHKKGTTLYSLNKSFPVTETNEPLYSLKGDFHLVGPSGWEYFGKDAELAYVDGPAGKMLVLYPRTALRQLRPVQGNDGKVTMQETEIGKPGTLFSVSISVNAKRKYLNVPAIRNALTSGKKLMSDRVMEEPVVTS